MSNGGCARVLLHRTALLSQMKLYSTESVESLNLEELLMTLDVGKQLMIQFYFST